MLEDLLVGYLSSKLESNDARSLQSAPLLSPTAEAELLLLATNFLLYVAMVIIVTIVCKIYFPDSLKRSENAQNISRSHSYLRVISGDDYVSGDDEEETQEEETQEETAASTPPGFLEFDMANSSRQAVVKRLAFCSMMLICTFVAWGALQERILTRRYPRITGEYFTYSYALVFTNRLWTFVMSGILLLYIKPSMSRSTIIYEYSFPSISNMLSSWCQYEALRYVSFPAATLFKWYDSFYFIYFHLLCTKVIAVYLHSFKLVPVMVRFNVVVIRKSYFPPNLALFLA